VMLTIIFHPIKKTNVNMNSFVAHTGQVKAFIKIAFAICMEMRTNKSPQVHSHSSQVTEVEDKARCHWSELTGV